MKHELTVVVPHYGDSSPTDRLVEMLLGQVDAPSFELIVVDDHSPRRYHERAGARVRYRDSNGGFGAAVNTGAADASGDLLLVLNSDIEIPPSFLRDLLLAARPWMPAVVSPRVVDHDGREAWTARSFPMVRHQVVEWLTPLARWRHTRMLHEAVGHDTRAHGADGPVVVDFVVGAAMLMPLAVFRSVGGFDGAYFMNSEEIELQRRLRQRGVPSVALPSPTLTHEGAGSSDVGLRRQWLVESRFTYAARWGYPRTLLAGLTLATGINLAWNAARRLAGRPINPLRTAGAELDLLRAGATAARRAGG